MHHQSHVVRCPAGDCLLAGTSGATVGYTVEQFVMLMLDKVPTISKLRCRVLEHVPVDRLDTFLISDVGADAFTFNDDDLAPPLPIAAPAAAGDGGAVWGAIPRLTTKSHLVQLPVHPRQLRAVAA